MKNSTLKVAAVLFGAAFAGQMFAGTPYTEVVLSKAAPVVLEAENFDKDGQDVSYHWNETPDCSGKDYRTDELFISDTEYRVGVNASGDASNGYILGWTNGVWAIYTVTVKDAGNYRFTMHAGAGEDGKSSWTMTNMNEDITVTGTLKKDDFVTWDNPTLRSSVVLSFAQAGQYEIKFSTGGGFNFDCWDVAYTTEPVTVAGNVIPGIINAADFIKGELGTDYHVGQVHLNQTIGGYLPESQLFGSSNIGWLNDQGWDTNVNPDLDCNLPDFFKYKTTILEAGKYYVLFEAAGPKEQAGEVSLYYYNYANPIVENIQFCRSGDWGDYVWAIGGEVADPEAGEVEPMIVEIKDDMVSKDLSDVKTIRLDVVHGFNLTQMVFVPVDQFDVDSFDPDEFDPEAIFSGINEVVVKNNANKGIYNLQGVKVAQPVKGIYVVNGKKVLF